MGYTAVLGIPYAAAPFGDRRFREPQPAEAWSGVRHCAAFGPIAPQSAELPGAPVWRPGDEDILTVNVWVPERAEGGVLPVLFWIHGGAYTFGSSAQPDFDGTALARAGLVVVSCNFRAGFEGFGHYRGIGSQDVLIAAARPYYLLSRYNPDLMDLRITHANASPRTPAEPQVSAPHIT
ncbi:hypothetical protein HEK616_79060 (plasmid) [Streptomyces nigrescens]|uniref:Carboxylesterase type B domain-containing protein n=1 Tax=Streptomyces nigrescens TaxID=1920 RepID=A0ABN6RCR0_STRNI|nr:hypothetical protein HEK616_79060 [Streptomyces nigrescens]